MTRMLMIAAMFGPAVAASACMQSKLSTSLAESQPVVLGDFPAAFGSSIPAPELREIDLHDFRIFGSSA